MQARTHKT